MLKLFIFFILWGLLGNPFLAILVMLIILYVLDRRFIGLTPSIAKPLRRSRRISRLRQELHNQPHNTSGKLELAGLLIEQRKYSEALVYLDQIRPILDDSAEVFYSSGLCHLKLGNLQQGEQFIMRSLEINPRVRFGEPYLRLGEAFATVEAEKAIVYLERFRQMQSSSCEAYYRLGQLYKHLNRLSEAKAVYQETLYIYRGLPKYKRRTERRWAFLAKWAILTNR